jgi:hypothetical protein
MERLAEAIDAIAERDQHQMDEGAHVDQLRAEGAGCLYQICRDFVDDLNARLAQPALVLDPPEWTPESFDQYGANLLQISLRGRLLQIEFTATDEPYSTEEFRHRYVLRGGVRSFNQDFLEQDTVYEQMLFYCPHESASQWHFFEPRTYRTGMLTKEYLAVELERLL